MRKTAWKIVNQQGAGMMEKCRSTDS